MYSAAAAATAVMGCQVSSSLSPVHSWSSLASTRRLVVLWMAFFRKAPSATADGTAWLSQAESSRSAALRPSMVRAGSAARLRRATLSTRDLGTGAASRPSAHVLRLRQASGAACASSVCRMMRRATMGSSIAVLCHSRICSSSFAASSASCLVASAFIMMATPNDAACCGRSGLASVGGHAGGGGRSGPGIRVIGALVLGSSVSSR
mmetsp:Transcript_35321/g.88599  ORF Transcript_35321/g.88599 Transcript_35321/m.88599 type:complete len:207 (-) Transcript_35321:618-1238(-)